MEVVFATPCPNLDTGHDPVPHLRPEFGSEIVFGRLFLYSENKVSTSFATPSGQVVELGPLRQFERRWSQMCRYSRSFFKT